MRMKALSIALALIISFFCTQVQAEETVVFAAGEWAPFISEDLPGYGPVAQVTTEACKLAGIKAEFEFLPWARSIGLVEQGKRVATLPWSKREDRVQKFHFSDAPLFVSKERVFFLKEKFPQGIEAATLADLKDYDVVGIKSYWYEEEAKKLGMDIHLVGSADLAWKLIASGRKDAYPENDLVARVDMKKYIPNQMDKIGHSETTLSQADMFILFSKTHPDGERIKAKLDKALEELRASGRLDEIMGQ